MTGADLMTTDAYASPSGMEETLRKKVQEQEAEIAAYQSHVVWASDYARLCEDRARAVDPLADINVAKGKVGYIVIDRSNLFIRVCCDPDPILPAAG